MTALLLLLAVGCDAVMMTSLVDDEHFPKWRHCSVVVLLLFRLGHSGTDWADSACEFRYYGNVLCIFGWRAAPNNRPPTLYRTPRATDLSIRVHPAPAANRPKFTARFEWRLVSTVCVCCVLSSVDGVVSAELSLV